MCSMRGTQSKMHTIFLGLSSSITGTNLYVAFDAGQIKLTRIAVA